MRAILTAKVDLLYNGGIGTYVKASTEEHTDAGDRTNDRVRVDAHELRARVVGEGGNLGLTQRGRIEFWTRGGLVNTDAVDNSAGVDMSDHEVNIKILLDMLVRSGVIKDRAARNAIIAEMTDNVSDLVLADNINQSRALTLDGMRSAAAYEAWVDFVESLVSDGIVSRADAALPRKSEFLASQGARPRPAAAGPVRAARPRQELGLRGGAEEQGARQRRRAADARRVLPGEAARRVQRALRRRTR